MKAILPGLHRVHTPEQAYAVRYAITATATLATAIEIIDTTIVSVAVPNMMGSLGATQPGHKDRTTGHGRKRGAWTGRDMSGRAEDPVDDRGSGRRVQPVLHRYAGDAGVSEVLGHDHRRDRDARDEVATEPSAIVAS